MRRLATEYVHNFPAVAPFFAGDPTGRTAWAETLARLSRRARPRTELAGVLDAQQRGRQAPEPAREAARALSLSGTVAIVTGQQAGLFGGPLFTWLKAITAIKLAAQVSAEHGVRCVPVFWVDAEDHDWDEVRSCTVFDTASTPRTIALPSRQDGRATPVESVSLDRSIEDALDALEQALPATEFRPPVLAALRDCYAVGVGMAEAFARWLEHVLGHRGLVVFDAADPTAKPLVADLFRREVSSLGGTARLAARAGADLVARGYHAQVHATGDALSLFQLTDGRLPIRVVDGGLMVGEHPVTSAELERQIADRPSDFGPNVLLRPLVQDTLFPTACYVAGPNELAYLGQLRGAYEHFDIPMPLIYPRASVTVLDAAAMRFLRKYGVALESLQPRDEAALNTLLATQIPQAVETRFEAASAALASTMAAVIEAIPAVDPTLEQTARSTLGRMQHDLEGLHGKMIQAVKRRDETLRRQFARTQALVFPEGTPQERLIGGVSFLNQYGWVLVDRLIEQVSLDLGHHWVITL